MLRFILRLQKKDAYSGLETNELFTLDAIVPEVEFHLTRGGIGESGYEHVSIEDIEVLQPNAGNNLREPGTGERQVD